MFPGLDMLPVKSSMARNSGRRCAGTSTITLCNYLLDRVRRVKECNAISRHQAQSCRQNNRRYLKMPTDPDLV